MTAFSGCRLYATEAGAKHPQTAYHEQQFSPRSTLPTTTSQSLLVRAQDRDPDAWRRITHLYAPIVYTWCRRAGLQECDAADVGQEVFRVVADKLRQFERLQAGSFRSWLKSITQHKLKEFFRDQARQPRGRGGSAAEPTIGARMEGMDDEATSGTATLAQRALELIRTDFEETTWKAFLRFTVDGQKAADVAAEFGMTAKAVRQAKCRILKRLRAELEGLA